MVQQLPGDAPHEAEGRQVSAGIDEFVRAPGREARRRVGQDHHGKLQTLGVVDGHQVDPVDSFFGNLGLGAGPPPRQSLQVLHEGPERASPAGLEGPGQIADPLHVGQNLVAGRAQRESRVSPRQRKEPGKGLGDGTAVAPAVQAGQDLQRVGHRLQVGMQVFGTGTEGMERTVTIPEA